MLQIKSYVLGMVSTNAYLVYDDETGEALIVDAAANAPRLTQELERLKLRPRAILLTHGHFDHIMAVAELAEHWQLPVYAGEQEAAMLQDARLNLSAQFQTEVKLSGVQLLPDGAVLELLGCRIRVIATPGHTAGSVCYYVERAEGGAAWLFSGDTLFRESMGRTDFPTGSQRALLESINQRLMTLPEDTVVYPGHEEPTDIAHEKKYNPAAIIAGML